MFVEKATVLQGSMILKVRKWCVVAVLLCGCTTEKTQPRPVEWIAFPDSRMEVRGLPWFKENAPELYRLPITAKGNLPNGVWARAVAPDGGRICFSSDTADLKLRVDTGGKRTGYFDVYVDGVSVGSAKLATNSSENSLLFFQGLKHTHKNITIYLPHKNPVRILAVGIDEGATLKPVAKFSKTLPMVCYGSSVLQGTGASHPSQTYPAIAARKLNLDFVNLGFGGAGKAEPPVVALVNQINASCYLFDLGKSYGTQGMEPFAKMLKAIRASHPTTPMIIITPIFSTKEISDPAYKTKSETLRAWMRDAANDLRTHGDKNVYVIEGLDLFGPADKGLMHDPLHPNDKGCEAMALRLLPSLKKAFDGQ